MRAPISFCIALIVLLWTTVTGCSPDLPKQSSPLDVGRALFESKALSTNGRSCSTCHPDGKGLEHLGDFSEPELKDIITACIRDALHGPQLADNSEELQALMKYVRTFQP